MCSFDGCDREVHCKGLCSAHYMQTRLGIELKPLRRKLLTEEDKKAARREASLAHYYRNAQRVNEIKLTSGCVDCGYNAHSEALDFDHVGDDKVLNVSRLLTRKWSVIEAEIAKCEVVCANCHRVRTRNRKVIY